MCYELFLMPYFWGNFVRGLKVENVNIAASLKLNFIFEKKNPCQCRARKTWYPPKLPQERES